MPRPAEPAATALVSYLETSLDAAAVAVPNPGRPALHRLNRAEYANAIRDLLALEVDPAVLLPPDDSSDGFDNNADVLGVSPALLERYLAAARKIGSLALGDPQASPSTRCLPRAAGHVAAPAPRGSAARHARRAGGDTTRFRATANTSSRSSCMETTLGQIRGLEYVNQVEVLLDGERIHLAEVGGTGGLRRLGRQRHRRAQQHRRAAHRPRAGHCGSPRRRRGVPRTQRRAGRQPAAVLPPHQRRHDGPHRLRRTSRASRIAGPFNATGPRRTPSRDRILACRPTMPAQEPGMREDRSSRRWHAARTVGR